MSKRIAVTVRIPVPLMQEVYALNIAHHKLNDFFLACIEQHLEQLKREEIDKQFVGMGHGK